MKKQVFTRTRLFLQGFFMVNLLWLLAAVLLRTPVVPSPLAVYAQFHKVLADGMALHVLYSLKRIALGLLLSLLVGVPVGILMACSSRAGKLLHPLVYFGYPIPKTALLPVAMLLWGMRDGSKVAILFLIIVFQVIIAVRDGVRNIDPSYYLVTVSTGASRWHIIRHVALPAILPELLTSTRISLGTAVSVLFFVEAYGTRRGAGYYIVDAWSRMDYVGMYSGILVISLLGFALFAGVDLLSEKLCPWKSPAQ